MSSNATRTNVVNRALSFGGKERLTSFNDQKEAGRVMKELYDETLDYMLEQHPWSFAKAVAELASQGDAEEASGWEYKFALPVDFLQIISINNIDVTNKLRVEYEIMGKSLYINDDSALLKYVKRETIVGNFSPKFVNAFAYALIRDAVKVLSEETGLLERLERKAEQELAEAKSMDMRREVKPAVSRAQYPTYRARRSQWY